MTGRSRRSTDRRRDEDAGGHERPQRGKERRRPQADDLGQQARRERRRQLGADRPDLDRRRHAPQRAIVDPRLADRGLRDVVQGHCTVADQLLADEEAEREDRNAGGRERDERETDARHEHRGDGRATDAQAPRDPLGDHRPDERAQATEARDDADRGGTEPQLVDREQDPDRPEHAPQRRHGHRRERECPDDRVSRDDRQAFADLPEDRLAVGLGRRRRFRSADRPEQHRRDDERDRVDEDRERGAQQLDEEAADAEGA